VSRCEGVLVDGPLAGRRVYVHLFALGLPMRHILVFERGPRSIAEWLRWKLWSQPPDTGAYSYRVYDDDETPGRPSSQREVRYAFDDTARGAEALAGSRELPTEIVFPRGRGAIDPRGQAA
jgi:hypothetical protein